MRTLLKKADAAIMQNREEETPAAVFLEKVSVQEKRDPFRGHEIIRTTGKNKLGERRSPPFLIRKNYPRIAFRSCSTGRYRLEVVS